MTLLSRREALQFGAALAMCPALLAHAGKKPTPEELYIDAILVDGQPPLPEAGSFTIAVMPDTQFYTERHPDTFLAQTRWLIENQKQRNIACMLHLGDITNRNVPEQWNVAMKALAVLDGQLPYFFVEGNHDIGPDGQSADRSTGMDACLPVSRFQSLSTFGGTYDKEPERMSNSFHRIDIQDRRFLILALEFGPRDDVVRWANEVAAAHPDREAILITHAYMYYDDTRYDYQKKKLKQSWSPYKYPIAQAPGGVNDGADLWRKLVRQHENFIMTLNGHVGSDGLGYLASKTPGDRDVHQLLVNFQMRPNGGDGWLRLMEFLPDGVTVRTYDYSPTLDKTNNGLENRLEFQLSKVGAAAVDITR